MRQFFSSLLIVLIFSTLIAVLYSSALSFSFTNYDDDLLILENPKIRHLSLSHLQRIWFGFEDIAYQPIQDTSFALDYYFWGSEHPEGFRFTNLFLYALNAFLFFLLAQQLLHKKSFAFIATCLFITHPTHVESVVWIAGRKDLLAGFFGLLTLWCWLNAKSFREFFLAFLFYIFALLSKPNMVILPILGALWVRYGSLKKGKSLFLACFATIPFFLLFFWIAQKNKVIVSYHGGSSLTTFYTMLSVYVDYFRLFFWPLSLSHYYEPPLYSSWTWKVIFGAFLLILSMGITVWGLQKRNAVGFLMGWFLFALFPYANLLPISVLIADRYLYFSGMALFIGAVFLLRQTKFVYALLGVALFWGTLSIQQAKIWKNSVVLWEQALQKYPNSENVLVSLGAAYLQRASSVSESERVLWWEKASKTFQKVLTLTKTPGYQLRAYFNLGVLACAKQDPGEAYPYFEKAENTLEQLYFQAEEEWSRSLKPGQTILLSDTSKKVRLRSVLWEKRKLDVLFENKEMLIPFKEAFEGPKELRRIQSNIYRSKGDLSIQAGLLQEALSFYRQAVKEYSDDPQPHVTLASILSKQDMLSEAYQELDIALALEPDFIPALATKGVLLMSEKHEDPVKAARRDQLAKQLFEKVLELDSNHIEAHFQLAMAVQPTDLQKFEFHLQKVLELESTHFEANRFLLRLYLQKAQHDPTLWEKMQTYVDFFAKRAPEDPQSQQELLSYFLVRANQKLLEARQRKEKEPEDKKLSPEVRTLFEEAGSLFSTVLQFKEDSAEGYYGKVDCALGLEDYERALGFLHQIRRLTPRDYRVLRHLGNISMLRQEYLQAIYYFKEYQQHASPEDVGGRYVDEQFIQFLQKKMEEEVWSLYHQGKTYLESSQWSEAKKILEQALFRNPRHPETNYLLSRIANAQQNWNEELQYLEVALSSSESVPPPQVYFDLGRVCLRLDQTDRAQQVLEKYLARLDAQVPERHELAEQYLKNAIALNQQKKQQAYQKIQEITSNRSLSWPVFFTEIQAVFNLLPYTPELKLWLCKELIFQRRYYEALQALQEEQKIAKNQERSWPIFELRFFEKNKFPVVFLFEAYLLLDNPSEKNILNAKYFLLQYLKSPKLPASQSQKTQQMLEDLKESTTRNIGKTMEELKTLIEESMPIH